tara:strand:- start:1386 stop:1571 length:186 start_codon:yes stop_codon:yes gene_type:complete
MPHIKGHAVNGIETGIKVLDRNAHITPISVAAQTPFEKSMRRNRLRSKAFHKNKWTERLLS